MLVIGLTGGIASGKSTVAQRLRDHGATVIDADLVGHEMYQPHSPAWAALIETFGPEIVGAEQTIDRRVLGGIVFGDADQMKKLTDILWPQMKQVMRERLADLERADTKVAVLEAAVLIEASWQDLVGEIWATVVSPDVAVARLRQRNGLSEEQARARLASQISNEERSGRADIVIDNSGSVEDLDLRVASLWQEALQRAV